ncbi:MAG: NAD(P)-binding domain-containing protein [Rubrivivax sp.]|nr:NAD(P)-binding domain-containing protein [Rubrivivax sp.]
MDPLALSLYVLVGLAVLVVHRWRLHRRERQALAARHDAEQQGLNEPPSLHPVVQPSRCIGSGGCVHACPEGALGIVAGKAMLVNPASCIGHGACQAACPVDAIQLVFGTDRRGVDIPELTPQFESNVPGLFIAGELGGMGLVRKAAEQGRQAVEHLRRRPRGNAELDLVIVGAGPAGLSAGLAAMEHKLAFRLVEQEDSLGGAVFHYPRQKITMTSPVKLALVGKVKVGEIRKEALLELWNGIVERTGLRIGFRERMEAIERTAEGGFIVRTSQARYHAASVLLAIGRRGTPRKLEVPGEESAKVTYRLVDPAQYRGQAVLVVGGGDSALEAALALAEEPQVQVALSYRGEAFSRVKEKNRRALEEGAAVGRLRLLLGSEVQHITPGSVTLRCAAGPIELRNDAVIVCAGGVLPTTLLQQVGVRFATKYGTA